MQDQLFIQECDHCGSAFKKSTRFATPQAQAAFNAELATWLTLGQHNGTPDGAQKHFCKRLCAIQYLQGLDSHEAAKTPQLVPSNG